ncbi:MAG: NAD-dependent epimerase/dehydratase family protein [Patescibacteria group bacterium]
MKDKGLVLVTGGAGFIGSHLVDGLIGAGYGVRVLDSLNPPTHNGKVPEWFNNQAELIKGDVRDRKTLEKALKGVDYVFHLAAYMDFLPDFSTYFTTNTASTALIYEIIVEKKLPVKKIIVTSSQSVYGEGKYRCAKHGEMYLKHRPEAQLKKKDWEMHCPQDGSVVQPVAENEDDILSPQIPYGISKLAAENVAMVLGKIYKIPTVSVRYSIVHGIRQSFRHFYSGALRSFAVQALSGKPLTIHEDGKQIRDFVNIKDVTAAHLLLLEDSRADYEAFNIGSGQVTTVLDVAKFVAKEAKIPFKPTLTGEYRLNTPRHQIMNIDKLKKLGWKPEYTLADNVKEYVQWVSNYPEAIKYFQLSDKVLKKAKIIK